MILSKKLKAEILRAAESAKPDEMCGFILTVGSKPVFYQAENISDKPSEKFEISAEDWIAAEQKGEIAAVVHSHPDAEPYLSGADRQIQVRQGLPWVLVARGRLTVYRPCPHLRGRVFEYGINDCYTLVRDAYHLMGIEMRDHPRTDMDSDAASDQFVNNLPLVGFVQVADGLDGLKEGDLILTALGGHANHAALYLGNGEILHHAYNQLSRREPLGRFWRDYTHSVWRRPEYSDGLIAAVLNDLIHTEM